MAFEKLLTTEQSTVLQCMKVILESDLLDDADFQTRLGVDKQQLREVIADWPLLNDADAASNTSLAINNCLNEICYGVNVNDDTLEQRYGISRHTVDQIYQKWKTGC